MGLSVDVLVRTMLAHTAEGFRGGAVAELGSVALDPAGPDGEADSVSCLGGNRHQGFPGALQPA